MAPGRDLDSHPGSNGITPLTIQPITRRPAKRTPSYFWGEDSATENGFTFPATRGYIEARKVIGDGSLKQMGNIAATALRYLDAVYAELKELDRSENRIGKHVVELRFSDELEQWRMDQFKMGNRLPRKGDGLVQASDQVIQWLGAEDWPRPLLTNCALWGGALIDMLIGAYDARTLYSNYCVDLSFYYEHNYHKVFPEFEAIVKGAMEDPYAIKTPHGQQRRLVAKIGLGYIKGKVAHEEQSKNISAFRSAKMDRETAFTVMLCENSIWGVAGESMSLGWDKAAVAHDLAFSAPATDVVDVGSDHFNSELFNSFLNTTDFTSDGVITTGKLRRVYDAYAHTCARMFTERWAEPGARLSTVLYPWHIIDGRHCFLRRALLGYSMRREPKVDQRESDWDEAFDADFRTTALSRPLKRACNGAEICDQVQNLIQGSQDGEVLSELWHLMTTATIAYASRGEVDAQVEETIAEDIRVQAAKMFSLGLVDNLSWLMSHASQHAWQVNYLFEAAMFGSLLDDEGLKSKVDRAE